MTGDPLNCALTDALRALGWRGGAGTPFDVLPLAIQLPDSSPRFFELPRDAVVEVPLVHPVFAWFANLGLKWHAVPAISGMRLEVGGVNYTAALFSGWYMGTEIGARDFGDASRYDVLPLIAEKMGLDTRSERSLWIDRALLEMNLAVIHSFAVAKVSLVDHHMAARHFMRHIEREEKAQRAITWPWRLARPTHVGFNDAGLSSGKQERHQQAQLLLSGGAMANLALIQRRSHPARSGHQVCAPIAACVAATNENDRRSRLGLALVPHGDLGLGESRSAGHVVESLARRVLQKRIKFVGHPEFDDSAAAAEILGPMPRPVGLGKRPRETQPAEVHTFFDAGLQDAKFLTREQEAHLFRKMNFLKYQAAQLQQAINPSRACSADLDRVEELLREAVAVRNQLICSYLGLVVSIVKKWTGDCEDFTDLVSVGNVALIQASEGFDCTRGTRFSTYVTRAIINDFVRRMARDRRRRARSAPAARSRRRALADHRDRAEAMDQEPPREMIRKTLGCLDDREQTIIVRHSGSPATSRLSSSRAVSWGSARSRVRQVESRRLG